MYVYCVYVNDNDVHEHDNESDGSSDGSGSDDGPDKNRQQLGLAAGDRIVVMKQAYLGYSLSKKHNVYCIRWEIKY